MEFSEETSVLLSWLLKIIGMLLSFIGGVVTATWIVATKVKGFDDRLRVIESIQRDCPGKAMAGLDEQLAKLPDKIEEKMEKKFERVHERIDEVLLHGKGGGG